MRPFQSTIFNSVSIKLKNKKFQFITLMAVILFAVFYTSLWFYVASRAKEMGARVIERASSELLKGHYAVKYDDMKVVGYPFDLKLVMTNLNLKLDSSYSYPVEEVTFPNLIIKSSLFQMLTGKYNIEVKDNIKLKFLAIKDKFILVYKGVPDIFIEFGGNEGLKKIRYIDSGYEILNEASNEVVASAESNNIYYKYSNATIKKDSIITFVMKSENINNTKLAKIVSQRSFFFADVGNISIDIDTKFTMPQKADDTKLVDSKAQFDKFHIKTDIFAIDGNGIIGTKSSEFAPYIEMTVTVNKYKQFIDYALNYYLNSNDQGPTKIVKGILVKAMNNFSSQLVSMLKAKESKDLKGNDDSLVIRLKRETGGKFTINDVNFTDIMQLFTKSFSGSEAQQPIAQPANAPVIKH